MTATDLSKAFEVELLEGIVGTLQDADTRAPWRYRESGTYTAGELGQYVDQVPESPASSVTLTDYSVSDDISEPVSVIGVQFRIQSADRALIRDAVTDLHALFHGRWGGSLGAITLEQSWRSSGTGIGQDANGRQVRTENYYFRVHRPSPQRN